MFCFQAVSIPRAWSRGTPAFYGRCGYRDGSRRITPLATSSGVARVNDPCSGAESRDALRDELLREPLVTVSRGFAAAVGGTSTK